MTMQIGEVTYHNFGPFQDITHDFSLPGLTVIEGRIEGKKGCDSNGSGKSFLFDGPAWALFGRCIRADYKGDDIVRLGSKGGAYVVVEFTGPLNMRVERYRKHSKYKNKVRLIVNGKDLSRGTNAQTDEAIVTAIGMDYDVFANSVAFGARDDVKSFFTAPDSERKRIIESMLGLDVYAFAEKEARRRLREATDELSAWEASEEKAQTAVDELTEAVSELRGTEDPEEIAFQANCRKAVVARLGRKATRLAKLIKKVTTAVQLQLDKMEAATTKYEAAQAEYDKAHKILKTRKQDADLGRSKLAGEVSVVKKRVAKFEALEDTCPTCEEPISEKKVEKITDVLNGEVEDLQRKDNLLQMELKGVLVDMEELVEPEEPEIPEEYTKLKARQDDLTDEKHALETKCASENARLEEAEKAQAELEEKIGAIESRIAAARKMKATAHQSVEETKELVDKLDFWVMGFGNGGLKSFLIEAELPEINKRATQYARRLLGEGAYVKLCATKTLKTKDTKKEEMTVEAQIPGCTESYRGASKGQKKRMDLSLLLAFRDLVASRATKPFRQLFADEIFDGLDRSGVESVAGLLRDISEAVPVSLVTHDARLKPVGNRIICLHHSGSCATITGGDVKTVKKPKKKGLKKMVSV